MFRSDWPTFRKIAYLAARQADGCSEEARRLAIAECEKMPRKWRNQYQAVTIQRTWQFLGKWDSDRFMREFDTLKAYECATRQHARIARANMHLAREQYSVRNFALAVHYANKAHLASIHVKSLADIAAGLPCRIGDRDLTGKSRIHARIESNRASAFNSTVIALEWSKRACVGAGTWPARPEGSE